MSRSLLVFLLFPVTLLTSACSSPTSVSADTVFMNGVVYTADDQRSWADAVAVKNGEIIFVGSHDGVEALTGRETNVVDLDGGMLMPGFHDAHTHIMYGGAATFGCDLHDLPDIASIRDGITACVATGKYDDDDWVIGGGWPLAAFEDGNPSAAMLDELLDGRPGYFIDAFAHSGWVNTRAMELAGITSETANPPQGVIVRNAETGEASGTLRDGAMALIEDILPEVSDEEQYAGLVEGLRRANQFGITAFIEPGADAQRAATYKSADNNGDMTARALVSLSPINELADRFDDEIYELLRDRDDFRGKYVNVDSVKVYIDGVIETRTSFMIEPYLDGSNFDPFYGQEELNELYVELDAMGIQIHTHAIGDGAIRSALNAYELALQKNGATDNRHQMVHLQLIDDDDIPRFGELGVAANFQCLWCYPDVYIDLAVDIVGKERVDRFYPVRSIRDSGGLVVGGSDWDVSSLNPLDAIETAIRRQNPFSGTDRVLGVDEEVDLTTALDMYTRNAAYVMRLDDITGSIEVGKRADLIVLDRNLFDIPATEINETKVQLTMMDGRIVYEGDLSD